MPVDCKVCSAPNQIRDLLERMRTAGISYRDCSDAIKTMRGYSVTHASIQRHEVAKHFEPGAVLASQTPLIQPGELTLKTMIDRKIELYWQSHKDEIPTSADIRAWLKLWADMREAEAASTEAQALRDMFRPALSAGIITVIPEED